MCTAMLYDPADHYEPEETKQFFEENKSGFERLIRFKEWKFIKKLMGKDKENNGGGENKTKKLLHYFFHL
jgi:hypothetical protein